MIQTQTLLNSADENLHFGSQMLANKTICTEPYDLPEGKRTQNLVILGRGKKALSMGGEKFVKCPVCVFNANQHQTPLKDDILLMFKSIVRQPNLNS